MRTKEGVTRMCGRCRHFCGSSLRLSPPYNRISHWREKRTVWLFIVRAGGGDPPSVCLSRRLLLPLFIYLSFLFKLRIYCLTKPSFPSPPLEQRIVFLSASEGFSCLNSAEIRTSIPGIKVDLLSLNMEFDCFQPYFFDHFDAEEDFYKSTAPSEDIWKKFELLPTPPMSPHRTLSGAALYLSPGDQLSWLTKVLGQDEDYEGRFLPDTEELLDNLSAHIIRDCMWSSFPGSKLPEKVGGGRACAAPVAPVRPSKAQCASPGALPAAPPDCVDPAAVLTFPASSCRKPASSGSESRSDSSDDDDEEIDVVTVESKQKRARPFSVRKLVTVTVRADPCPKRFHVSVHRQQHNYAARSPDSDPEPDDEEDEEEEDDDYEEEPRVKRTCPASPSDTTPQSSDVEDTDRRKNHNFLERKRRNDLRSRFLALRDEIPSLEAAKAPKVAILTQATEYLMELHTKERRNLQEKKRLKSRQQQLLRRLSELKRS